MNAFREIRRARRKAGLLAAVSMIAAASATGAVAQPANVDHAGHPMIVEAQATQLLAHGGDHADEVSAASTGKKYALFAIAAGAIAGLVRLIGARRVADAVVSGTVKTAKVAGKAAIAAAGAVGRAAKKPLRLILVLFGLGVFALTGVGVYGLEWSAGLISGAGLALAATYGAWKTRLALRPARVNPARSENTDNRN